MFLCVRVAFSGLRGGWFKCACVTAAPWVNSILSSRASQTFFFSYFEWNHPHLASYLVLEQARACLKA